MLWTVFIYVTTETVMLLSVVLLCLLMAMWLMAQLVMVLVQVLFPTVDGDEKFVQPRAANKKVSIYHCEMKKIALGLTMIVDYF